MRFEQFLDKRIDATGDRDPPATVFQSAPHQIGPACHIDPSYYCDKYCSEIWVLMKLHHYHFNSENNVNNAIPDGCSSVVLYLDWDGLDISGWYDFEL